MAARLGAFIVELLTTGISGEQKCPGDSGKGMGMEIGKQKSQAPGPSPDRPLFRGVFWTWGASSIFSRVWPQPVQKSKSASSFREHWGQVISLGGGADSGER
jgi:hypothetical protein